MDRGAWRATYSPWVHKESDMTNHACTHAHTHTHTHTVMIINLILPIKRNNLDELIVIISSTLSLLKTSHLKEIFTGTMYRQLNDEIFTKQ